MPFFSIIIPTFNRDVLVIRAIDSVIAQTCDDWELIVIDDASTDNTAEYLDRYSQNSKIIVIRNGVNLERSVSRNIGIERSNGSYICFLDSDDYYLESHLQELYDLIQIQGEPVAFFYATVLQEVDGVRKILPVSIDPKNPVESVILRNIPPTGVCIHKDILSRERFPVGMNVNEDVYLFARIVAQYPFFGHQFPTVVWVMHGGNTNKQFRDYLGPQIEASKVVFGDPVIQPFLSDAFKNDRYHGLYSALVHQHIESFPKALQFLRKAWAFKPGLKNNKGAIGNILYHLPFGVMLRKLKRVLGS
ncbi:MAG: glycosyltransferase [Saprospiraceae bacterium]